MKSSSLLLLASCFLGATAKATQTDMKKRVAVDDGKIVLHQVCNSGMDNTEVSSLKKAVEMIKERLDKNEAKDPWIKLNTAPVCFGAKGNQFGEFSVPSGGSLLAIKLVHVHGYVTCDKNKAYHWSQWGCGAHSSLKDHVDVVITTSTNSVLLPPSQFIGQSWLQRYKWSRIPGYNSLSSELVLSVFSSPLTVTSGQVLRVWYGEDLVNQSEGDNDGTSCCDVFARFM